MGLPTLTDILAELARPAATPARFEAFSFAPGVEKLEDLEPGLKLPGIVTTVTRFGAFVDVGVHQDGRCTSAAWPTASCATRRRWSRSTRGCGHHIGS